MPPWFFDEPIRDMLILLVPVSGPADQIRSLFDADPQSADAQIRSLHAKLLQYFSWRRCREPEELVSETLCRALDHIRRGAEVGNLENYCYGIAFNVLREQWKKRPTESIVQDPVDPATVSLASAEIIERRRLVEECLNLVSTADRKLLEGYYLGDREEFLKQAGGSSSALRVRVFRVVSSLREKMNVKHDPRWRHVSSRGAGHDAK